MFRRGIEGDEQKEKTMNMTTFDVTMKLCSIVISTGAQSKKILNQISIRRRKQIKDIKAVH
jgi:hypothetical protein